MEFASAFTQSKFQVSIPQRRAVEYTSVASETSDIVIDNHTASRGWRITFDLVHPTRSVGLQGSSARGLRRLALPPPKIAAARRVSRCVLPAESALLQA